MEMGKREGAQGNFSFPLPLSCGIEEGRGRSAPAPIPAPWGSAAAGDGGKRGREARGFHPPSHLGPGWSVEGGPRGLAAVVLGGSGGGAREPGRRNAGAAWLVVVMGDARGLL